MEEKEGENVRRYATRSTETETEMNELLDTGSVKQQAGYASIDTVSTVSDDESENERVRARSKGEREENVRPGFCIQFPFLFTYASEKSLFIFSWELFVWRATIPSNLTGYLSTTSSHVLCRIAQFDPLHQ